MAERFEFLETDSAEIHNSILDFVMDEVDEPLYPGDERRMFMEAVILVLVQVYNNMNDTAKQKMLQYARGYVLDALGEQKNTKRLEASPASDTFRFTLSAAQSVNTIIPEGTRITPDGEIYFATTAAAVLQAGSLYVDVHAECMTAGEEYNGLPAGSVNVLVDLIPYVAAVENLNGTSGGDDGEPYPWEDGGAGDERYRERIQLASGSYSVAATESSIRYFALSADPDIIDVSVDSPEGNQINIYPLMKGGAVPTEDDLKKIQAVFDDDVRLMTDVITVKAPTQKTYDITLKYYCTLDNEAQAAETVEAAGGALDLYKEWQCGALGRDINPDYLKKLILAPADGTSAVDRVDITAPVFASLDDDEVAKFSGQITVTHGRS